MITVKIKTRNRVDDGQTGGYNDEIFGKLNESLRDLGRQSVVDLYEIRDLNSVQNVERFPYENDDVPVRPLNSEKSGAVGQNGSDAMETRRAVFRASARVSRPGDHRPPRQARILKDLKRSVVLQSFEAQMSFVAFITAFHDASSQMFY